MFDVLPFKRRNIEHSTSNIERRTEDSANGAKELHAQPPLSPALSPEYREEEALRATPEGGVA
jgi:hypothetical protein